MKRKSTSKKEIKKELVEKNEGKIRQKRIKRSKMRQKGQVGESADKRWERKRKKYQTKTGNRRYYGKRENLVLKGEK